jgi:hypothetical protein
MHAVVPHIVPSVVREQLCISVVSLGVHALDAQWNVRTVRDCVPIVVHESAKFPHAPNAPIIGAGQSASLPQPMQRPPGSSHVPATHGLPECTLHVPPPHVSMPLQNV